MARIRTIKPEFYSSPGIESLEFAWRILYIAMWNWADDTGRGTAEARELMGFAFPLDEDMTLGEFRRGLGEVRRVFGVTFYKVDGRSYYAIPAWDKHQKIDKRSGSKWPGPDDGLLYDPATNSAPIQGSSQHSAETHESPPSVRRDVGAGTGEQGNRGTEEQPLVTSRNNVTSASDEKKHAALRIVHGWTNAIMGSPPPSKIINDVTVQVQALVHDGIDPQYISAGLAEWWQGKYPASTLPNYVTKHSHGRGLNDTPSQRRLQQGYELTKRAAARTHNTEFPELESNQ